MQANKTSRLFAVAAAGAKQLGDRASLVWKGAPGSSQVDAIVGKVLEGRNDAPSPMRLRPLFEETGSSLQPGVYQTRGGVAGDSPLFDPKFD